MMKQWISPEELKNWTKDNSRRAAEVIPELLLRLIVASGVEIEQIEIPNGNGIAYAGWDGHLRTKTGNMMIPEGRSVWEIGTQWSSPGDKIKKDYDKRSKKPNEIPQKETTYVGFTPEVWEDHLNWELSKQKEWVWKNVKTITAVQLWHWLDQSPAVASWLCREIGKTKEGMRDIGEDWEEWVAATIPKMTPDMVIAGRSKNVEDILKWLMTREPWILDMSGDSPDEPKAFLYSSIQKLPEREKLETLWRCLVVRDEEQFRLATEFKKQIIVAPSSCRDLALWAVEKGHHVFLTAEPRMPNQQWRVQKLDHPIREVIEKELVQSGKTPSDARKIARAHGTSIVVLRRNLFYPTPKPPVWSNEDDAAILIPLLLSGWWDENKEGDRGIMESLSGMKYQDYALALRKFLKIYDSPLQQIWTVWLLKSPLDAWLVLKDYLTDQQLELFQWAITSVLTNTDPKFDLKAEERWAAQLYGKISPYSEWMITGLVEALILLAIYSEQPTGAWSTQLFADRVIKAIFSTTNEYKTWASIRDITPLISEAAPEAFLEVLKKKIAEKPELFQELMKDNKWPLSSPDHAGLLWALEGMAWHPLYFSRSVETLFQLSKIDLDNSLSNRPLNSLVRILLPWFPQTNATPEQRIATFDKLVDEDPKLAWKIVENYYGLGGVIVEWSRFKWRESGWNRRGREPENGEDNHKYATELWPRIEKLSLRKENIISAIWDFISLPHEMKESVTKYLKQEKSTIFSPIEHQELYNSIRKTLHWLYNYGDHSYAQYIEGLEQIYKKYTPTDILDRYAPFLADPQFSPPQVEPKGFHEQEAFVAKLREEAAREVLKKVELAKIFTFSENIDHVGILWDYLGRAVLSGKQDDDILDALVSRGVKSEFLLRWYTRGRVRMEWPEWVEKQIQRLKAQKKYSPEVCANLYLGLTENIQTWKTVESLWKRVEKYYWKFATGRTWWENNEEAQMAVMKLLEAKRPYIALTIAGTPKISIPSKILQRILQDVVKMSDIQDRTMLGFYVGHLFAQIDKEGVLPIEEIASLEWAYSDIRDEIRTYRGGSWAIHRMLQENPTLFTEMVWYAWKRDDWRELPEKKTKINEKQQGLWRMAYNILGSWHLLPWLTTDGSIDEQKLLQWISEAQKKCAETKYTRWCDYFIGKMLWNWPADKDGIWPHESIRNTIEKLDNDNIDGHIEIELRNSRWLYQKNIWEWGEQEKAIMGKYLSMSDKVMARWPRTSAILRSVAESYWYEAKREDIVSDLERAKY